MPTLWQALTNHNVIPIYVVIAAMIGAGLCGKSKSYSKVPTRRGFEAGLGVVVLAIILDRITQSIGKNNNK